MIGSHSETLVKALEAALRSMNAYLPGNWRLGKCVETVAEHMVTFVVQQAALQVE